MCYVESNQISGLSFHEIQVSLYLFNVITVINITNLVGFCEERIINNNVCHYKR